MWVGERWLGQNRKLNYLATSSEQKSIKYSMKLIILTSLITYKEAGKRPLSQNIINSYC